MSSTTRTGGWSSSSSRTPTTRYVLFAPSGILSPERQFGTALLSVAGSAGKPSIVSSLNRNTVGLPPFVGPRRFARARSFFLGGAGRKLRGVLTCQYRVERRVLGFDDR
jgi:hypothetical protein